MPENNVASSLNINLIAYQKNKLQQILAWVLTYGLIIAAVTTVAVIGLSTYKFSLQNQVTALNQDITEIAEEIRAKNEFENQFLLAQTKLNLYQEILQSEKIEDLFPKLSVLVPEGVQVRTLSIEPARVQITCYVTDQTALTRFVNNLNLASTTVFPDGQKLSITNTTANEIVKNSANTSSNGGYDFSLSFNYAIN